MIKRLLSIVIILLALLQFQSCKKCKTCQCWKDGVEYEERNCAYGGMSSNRTQETWERYLIEEDGYGYDSVRCVIE
jgi:hypothetical protein